MRFNPQKIACALDIGQSSVKILMARRGVLSPIIHAQYDLEKEGFLDSSELFGESGIIKWLRELKLDKYPVITAIPQYLCTTKVLNDYPKNIKDEALRSLIDGETRNLAGLSDESFVSDYQRMEPIYGVENPILAGFCRQQVPEQSCGQLEAAGIKMANATMGSIAVANALFSLHPDACQAKEPHIILDIGKETSTCVITLGGNILNTCSLMAGADHCAKGTDQLFNELNNAVDNWKNSELQEIAEHYIDKIWLCGGGAHIQGLEAVLAQRCNCQVQVFGPSFGSGATAPEYALAYGLAMQEIGEAKYAISLAPGEVCWRRIREDRFPTLALACGLLFLFLFSILGFYNYTLDVECSEMHAKIDNLRKCDSIIPKLDGAIAEMEYHQLLLTPIVELGNRSKVYMRSLEELSHSLGENDWCIYFSDQFSHKDYAEQKVDPKKEAASKQKKKPGLFETTATQAETVNVDKNSRIVLHELPMLDYLVVGGYTTQEKDKSDVGEKYRGRYGAVLKIQEKLMHKDSSGNSPALFTNVDWLNENKEWTGREAEVSQPWNAYLKNNKNYFSDYT